ncbi:MAG: hypothetical protein WKF82_02735 [Nocardioidaceae bacterium]
MLAGLWRGDRDALVRPHRSQVDDHLEVTAQEVGEVLRRVLGTESFGDYPGVLMVSGVNRDQVRLIREPVELGEIVAEGDVPEADHADAD